MNIHEIIDYLRVPPGKKVRLKDYDPGWQQTKELHALGKEAVRARAEALLAENLAELTQAQDLLWAADTHAILVILQALDAAGKDGMIKHVMSGLNPQACQVHSFKQPSAEELDHDFLWRCVKALPERGRIGIFNRSYYEEVLVVKVHPELLEKQKLPPGERGKAFWATRYDDINALEQHLVESGTVVVKFFLNVSKAEQKRRFLERLDNPEKHWKFSAADVAERAFWGDYQRAYEDMLNATTTKWAPWYVIPADHKWAARALVAAILAHTVRGLKLRYPELSAEGRRKLAEARRRLEAE